MSLTKPPRYETNYDHLIRLSPWQAACTIVNLLRDPCVYCPKLRYQECRDDCDRGILMWLKEPYIPTSGVWKVRKR